MHKILSLLTLFWSSFLFAESIDINKGWLFSLGENKQNDTRLVDLPHDWSIEDIPGTNSPFDKNSIDAYDTGYTVGGVAWYRKSINIPEVFADKVAYLSFGGIYMQSTVYVNGKVVGGQYNGYTSFTLDITKHIRFGFKNHIEVRVENNHSNGRWYSGSGIYRLATLEFVNNTHIAHQGSQILTHAIQNNSATLDISTLIVNDNQQPIYIKHYVFDGDKLVKSRVTRQAASESEINTRLQLSDIQRWDLDNPKLYTLIQNVFVGGKKVQSKSYDFGIREIEFNGKSGFLLNGEPVLLKGMNIHHDNYMLGAAAHPAAEYRKALLIKNAGYNAVRTSHNPPSKAFLQAADRIGLLIITELFDSWNEKKWDHVNDYSSVFSSDWQRDLHNFILRDINHPSIIMWSIGNEIPEQWKPLGTKTAKMLRDEILKLDISRPVTIGANFSGEASDDILSLFSVVGYNYQEHNYQQDRKRNPSRLMYASESYSNKAFENWQYVLQHPYVIGDFVWTGWDYLGEASIGWTGYKPEWKGIGPYPWHLAYCGEMDALGFKRPAAFYRDVLWDTGQNKLTAFVKSPELSLQPAPIEDWFLMWTQEDLHANWYWPEQQNKTLDVVVYSRYPQVELVLNGESQGVHSVSEQSQFKTLYQVNYLQGTLEVRGLKNGKIEKTYQLVTADNVAQFLTEVKPYKHPDYNETLFYITVQLADDKANPVTHWSKDMVVNLEIDGDVELIGFGNGHPAIDESFKQNSRSTFKGQAVAVIKADSLKAQFSFELTGKTKSGQNIKKRVFY
ncbi:glycoside hydrolase family 2 TIM barrel-domain containing protein [Catenovulum sediminis]|uniref:glycoside hydrolase family 2 TIM barrel-domain containing protein n=1 Tax=Catenovulum sediminis TaxID=1740262 RepID=UPI00117D92B9|nr:glycoside hydrolase family 2 TIM barrel-domain containing protein [Catenovulum sediminis]